MRRILRRSELSGRRPPFSRRSRINSTSRCSSRAWSAAAPVGRSSHHPPAEQLDTHHKALTLNLARTIFGSFAEIGAGQEVARWFLRVAGASGTVAKAISAYDKEVSDDLYGAGTRYVSRQRLEAMLLEHGARALGDWPDGRDTSGPMLRFGTKCPSMTSTWMRRTPASSASDTWVPSRRKSADRIEGAISTRRVLTGPLPDARRAGTSACSAARPRRWRSQASCDRRASRRARSRRSSVPRRTR